MNNQLKDKIRGIIFGAAIGDALGFGCRGTARCEI